MNKKVLIVLFYVMTLLVAGCIPEYDADYNSKYVELYVNDNSGGYIKNVFNETITIKLVHEFKGAESTMWIKELDPGQNTSISGDQLVIYKYYLLLNGVEKELIRPIYKPNNCFVDMNGERTCGGEE